MPRIDSPRSINSNASVIFDSGITAPPDGRCRSPVACPQRRNGGAQVHGDPPYLRVVMWWWAAGTARMRLPHSAGLGSSARQMTEQFDKFAARAAPAIFVVLWSTGFVGTKYVIHNADPLTYLAIRMAIVVALMALICAIARPRWLDRREIGHSIVAGILVHGIYLGGTAVAISLSIPAGLSALIPGLQPILTSTIANR